MAARNVSVAAPPVADDKLVSSLIALMERGTAPWRREWDGQRSGQHVNLFSGRPYRGANPILLTFGLHQRGASLPYWCGAVEAKRHGLLPKRGSKTVIVLRPQVWRRPSAAVDSGSAATDLSRPEEHRTDEREERVRVRYRPLAVFNVADLEGEALSGLITARQEADQAFQRSEPERLTRAEAVLQAWPVPMDHGGVRAYYSAKDDRIHLPERRAFHSAEALYATWAHEAIHSTGHPTRLSRHLSSAMGSEGYAREELVAELGAVLLGERLEIGSDVSNHAAYLSEWILLLRQSPSLLYKLLSEARQAADLICPPQPAEGG
ncbi:MAG: zincin-like metallopeptidase domain-containing protein [Cyanobacteriota bacterium]|nr:zincin-like metallopeptidase domain-containing protein [Cyanobacteriota bacterium]